MKTHTYYGMLAWHEWDDHAPSYLGHTRQSVEELRRAPALEVRSYREMAKVVFFLNVMNKEHDLLFRGQSQDVLPLPALLRDSYTTRQGETIPLPVDRLSCWDQLPRLCEIVATLLADRSPRHAPFRPSVLHPQRRVAPWAIIQHYELWPTPLLDLTRSPRIAASFALGLQEHRDAGYVYVVAAPAITSDVMAIGSDRRGATVRLSAVCPPDAARPHLQEGFLAGDPSLTREDVARFGDDPAAAAEQAPHVVAKFRLVDAAPGEASGGFWDEELPKYSAGSLLPPVEHDPVAEVLHAALTCSTAGGRLALVER